ncbi:MAG: dihydroorotate dehydrogenase electron transfer subunit [Dehalococcoidales bacterium]|nr:dihydroorotate dehydrogenase electron transfer subunit [Dehalococcoidales bacterium]
MKQATGKVISNEQILKELERPGARTILGSWLLWLECPEIAHEARPGQFVMVVCGSESFLPRPFSIHQVKGDNLALFFAAYEDGKGTTWLSQVKVASKIGLLGPLGNGFSIYPGSHNLLLVAGGIGIAPLYFLATQALNHSHEVKLILGASGAFKPSGEPNPVQHYPEELLPRGIEIETITTSPDGMTGNVVELIPGHVSWADQVFACGPLPMYKTMAQMPELKGKQVQVSLEVVMGCGRGVCYGCTIKTKSGLKRVCEHGPVFHLDDILWDEFTLKS